MLSSSGVRTVVHTSDKLSQSIEALQLDLGEGPRIDASSSITPVLVADLRDPREGVADRWPFFLPRVDELGIRALFAFPHRLGSKRLGTLGLYRCEPGRLTAHQLSTAFRTADDRGSANVDLGRSASVVHQATGMVMIQPDSTIDEAMAMLRASAFADGLFLIELSSQVVHGRRRVSKEQT